MQNPYLDLFLENFYKKDDFFGWEGKGSKKSPEHPYSCKCEECKEYIRSITRPYELRNEWTKKYAWAVPTGEAIDLIASHSPHGVVEIGAGTGYWCWLLKQKGVKVRPYDRQPLRNHYIRGCWLPISKGTHRALLRFSSETLLLCWPEYLAEQASSSVKYFQGDTLAYVGEGWSGCTGDNEFFELVEGEGTEWYEVDKLDIPNYPGIHDSLHIYKRN